MGGEHVGNVGKWRGVLLNDGVARGAVLVLEQPMRHMRLIRINKDLDLQVVINGNH